MKILVTMLVFVLSAPLNAQSALEIFDSAVQQFDARQQALKPWQYYQTLTTRQLDINGRVIGKGQWCVLVRPGADNPVEYLSGSTEGELTLFDQPQTSGRKAAGKEVHEENNQPESVAEAVKKYRLRGRYQWTRLPDSHAGGKRAYVLRFTPKENQPDTRGREARFLSLLAGKLWISKDDYSVLRAEAALQEPMPLLWIIARIKRLEFVWEAIPNRANPLLRKSIGQSSLTIDLPFKTVRQTHQLTVDHYERRTAE